MSVHLERAGNRIYVTAPYPIAALHKAVPGSNFSKTGGPHWSCPLSLDSCELLRERFGAELEIGPDLWAWARAAKAEATAMSALGRAADAELLRVPERSPVLAKAMANRTYQRVGARFIAEGRAVLLADQPGLGKTLEAIGGVIEAGTLGPYLVVCPKTAVEAVWAREIPRWMPGARVLTVPDGRAKRDAILDAFASVHEGPPTPWGAPTRERTWVVVHPEMLRTKSYWICRLCGSETPVHAGRKELVCGDDPKTSFGRDDHEFPQLFAQQWGAIIADESSRCLVRLKGKSTQARRGMELLRNCDENWLRIAMDGTPFRSRPHLLWGTLNWLDAQRHPAFWSWCETYWDVQSGEYAPKVIGALRPDREERLWRSLNRVMLRRTKEEVAQDLPPKTYVGQPLNEDPHSPAGVWLPMSAAQAKAYDQMFKTSVATIEGGDLSALGILAEMTRLKQFATSAGQLTTSVKSVQCDNPNCPDNFTERYGANHRHEREVTEFAPVLPSNKFEYLVELLTQLGFPDDPQTKVVVVSQFTRTLELFAAELAAAMGATGRSNTGRAFRSRLASVLLTGNVTGTARQRAIDEFNRPVGQGPHVMFLNVKAGGVAITLDTADHMVLLDETWIPDEMEQVEDRIHRVSNPRPVWYHYLRSSGSIEEAIALANMQRDVDSKRLLDGRRGVEYARRVMEVARKL